MQQKVLKIHSDDNVAVALMDINAGTVLDDLEQEIRVLENTPAKHKVALVNLEEEDPILMYGVLVGKASKKISKGEILTTSNTVHESRSVVEKTGRPKWEGPDVSRWKERTFMGYHRKDGQVGTANIWLFFPLVFCENRNIEVLKEVFEKEFNRPKDSRQRQLLRNLIEGKGTDTDGLSDQSEKERVFDNIEARFITHQGGCGGIRQDAVSLSRLLAGYVNNPNVAGATVLSLGCQNLQIDIFKNALETLNPDIQKPVLIYQQQDIGSTEEMLDKIIIESFREIKKANEIHRKPAVLSNLRLGLECGGSDGFSGISANPALGYASDVLAALGGSPILSEFPELCGVEQELVNRCVDGDRAKRFMELMKTYEKTAEASGSGFDMNPSPGNIRDGLITDAMKSAGAAKKGGTSPVTDVLDYGEYVTKSGLNLLCTPGNDVESTTALVGAGANLVVFTTGLGTPTGNPVAPVIKLASNSAIAKKMPDIIDIDAGGVVKGEKTIQQMGEELLELIINVASGRMRTKADELEQFDFIPWKRGVSL